MSSKSFQLTANASAEFKRQEVFRVSLYNLKKMKKILTLTALFLSLLSITGCSSEGKLHITSNAKGATIFIDGEKKGIIADGIITITVDEGEHEIRIFKHTQEWDREGIKQTFVADKSSIEVYVYTDITATQYRIDRLNIEIKKQLNLDKKSGTVVIESLMWKRCSEGQTWNGNTCIGKGDGYEWQIAQDHAKGVNFAEYSDWRVPTIKELNTLVYCSNGHQIKYKKDGFDNRGCGKGGTRQKPTINQTVFPNTPTNGFWSSSSLASYSGYAWQLNFSNGNDDNYYRYNDYYVRLVRSRQ
ncbi:hypothetical protein BGC33_04090 [Bathymodiolus thermophilus thioautotrophic gill symbiont]|uniref:Uncharacterized protein n=2 Tax=Bathymodiolus thermophilus thioautotrophic gill symbiont TaxID=2360 RepID=A0A1J5TV13_9GAMM|nr:hypothetical protein BGC33_04090 [Bathymodiolus thermophilus thioautotrophic gill symbiont]